MKFKINNKMPPDNWISPWEKINHGPDMPDKKAIIASAQRWGKSISVAESLFYCFGENSIG